MEVDYKAASSSGADDGFLELYVDDQLAETISSLNNDSQLIGWAQLGVPDGPEAGSSGALYYDCYVSTNGVDEIGMYSGCGGGSMAMMSMAPGIGLELEGSEMSLSGGFAPLGPSLPLIPVYPPVIKRHGPMATTPTATMEAEETETVTPTPKPTATGTPEPTTTEPVPTSTLEAVPTDTPEVLPTETPEAVPSDTPDAEPTDTPEPEPTSTPETAPTETTAPEPTATEISSLNDDSIMMASYRPLTVEDALKLADALSSTVDVSGPLSIGQGAPLGAPVQTTITYTYYPLNRLTDAVHDSGANFHYTHDAVGRVASPKRSGGGNMLTESGSQGSHTYVYDIANRLTSVDSVAHTWDNNGNLTSDGVNTYSYNSANRLTSVTIGTDVYNYTYDGLGDRYQQIFNSQTTTYQLDLAAPLTQVLADGADTYLYGLQRISQYNGTSTEYFLPDALGSVRQMVDPTGELITTKDYEPFSMVLDNAGNGVSM